MVHRQSDYFFWSLMLLLVTVTMVLLGVYRTRQLYAFYDLALPRWTVQVISPWYQVSIILLALSTSAFQVRPVHRLRYLPIAKWLALLTCGHLVYVAVGLLLPLVSQPGGLP